MEYDTEVILDYRGERFSRINLPERYEELLYCAVLFVEIDSEEIVLSYFDEKIQKWLEINSQETFDIARKYILSGDKIIKVQSQFDSATNNQIETLQAENARIQSQLTELQNTKLLIQQHSSQMHQILHFEQLGRRIAQINLLANDNRVYELRHLPYDFSQRCNYVFINDARVFFCGEWVARSCTYIYNFPMQNLTKQPDMQTGRSKHAIVRFENQIFVFAGIDSSFDNTKTVESFNLTDSTWRYNLDSPVELGSAHACVHSGVIYVVGDSQSIILPFDPSSWLPYGRAINLSPRQYGPIHKAVFGNRDKLYVISHMANYEVQLESEEVIEREGVKVDDWVQGEVTVLTGIKTVAYLGYSKGIVMTLEIGDELSIVAERNLSSVFI